MSDPRERLRRLQSDAREAPDGVVLYLEGKTDPPLLFGLLGLQVPRSDSGSRYFLDSSVIVGLSQSSGRGGVEALTRMAADMPQLRARVVGITDGDGRPWSELQPAFHTSQAAGLYAWPAWCIENMLTQAGWPPEWGPTPDWREILPEYAAYVALVQLFRAHQQDLGATHLARHPHPDHSQPLLTVGQVASELEQGWTRVRGHELAALLQEEATGFVATVQRDLAEAHTRINGKWLVKRIAVQRQIDEQTCALEWSAAIARAGGSPPVRAWWERVVGPLA